MNAVIEAEAPKADLKIDAVFASALNGMESDEMSVSAFDCIVW